MVIVRGREIHRGKLKRGEIDKERGRQVLHVQQQRELGREGGMPPTAHWVIDRMRRYRYIERKGER